MTKRSDLLRKASVLRGVAERASDTWVRMMYVHKAEKLEAKAEGCPAEVVISESILGVPTASLVW